jgi:hypothetical protein
MASGEPGCLESMPAEFRGTQVDTSLDVTAQAASCSIACSLAGNAPTAHGFQVGQTAWSPTWTCEAGTHQKG